MLRPHDGSAPAGRPSGLPLTRTRARFEALAQDGALELLCYGEIIDPTSMAMLQDWGVSTDGLVSSLNVKKALDAAAGTYSRIRVRINSPGGDAFEGMAIHALLTGSGVPVECCIDGLAASSAAIVAMAGGTRTMGQTSMMMIHNAWSACVGNKADMLKTATTLDSIDATIAGAFTARTGLTLPEIQSLMDAESWMSAADCVRDGFATAIAELPEAEAQSALVMARGFRALDRWHNLPEAFRGGAAIRNDDLQGNATGCECECMGCRAGDCRNCSNEDCMDLNCEDCPMQAGGGPIADLALREAELFMLQRGIGV